MPEPAVSFPDPVLERIERIARSDASVLVVGETGTGKELIARQLHAASGRQGPFVAVNCGAFSETLIDAELFGHESGAFTGAAQARAGWFEAANGGTLFLDEIGDLPAALQVKLLRVLQERQVVRLGSRKPIALDVRVVAATNVDLHRAVEAQRFRADLYYRLGVATLSLPPLRERSGDILPLARHFIGVHAPRLGLGEVALAADAEAALLGHAWPGNIRELENVVHFALIVCRHGSVRAADLRLAANAADAGLHAAATPDVYDRATQALGDALERYLAEGVPDAHHTLEATLVRSAFRRAGENQVHAARLLGISRNSMRTLLKRHGLIAERDVAPAIEATPHVVRATTWPALAA
ncbi:MAG: sigma 54-interacting transcriptional regulator [Piscinibacter sp.]